MNVSYFLEYWNTSGTIKLLLLAQVSLYLGLLISTIQNMSESVLPPTWGIKTVIFDIVTIVMAIMRFSVSYLDLYPIILNKL